LSVAARWKSLSYSAAPLMFAYATNSGVGAKVRVSLRMLVILVAGEDIGYSPELVILHFLPRRGRNISAQGKAERRSRAAPP
jgi:hypothetical protein